MCRLIYSTPSVTKGTDEVGIVVILQWKRLGRMHSTNQVSTTNNRLDLIDKHVSCVTLTIRFSAQQKNEVLLYAWHPSRHVQYEKKRLTATVGEGVVRLTSPPNSAASHIRFRSQLLVPAVCRSCCCTLES